VKVFIFFELRKGIENYLGIFKSKTAEKHVNDQNLSRNRVPTKSKKNIQRPLRIY
jgi:hypothetical protein